jgi:Do/DeqQ family serine protease
MPGHAPGTVARQTLSRKAVTDTLRFLAYSAAVGLAAAAAVLLLLPGHGPRPVVQVVQSAPGPMPAAAPAGTAQTDRASYAEAVAAAAPAVVNIYTTRVVVQRPSPLVEDPVLRQYFGGTLGTPRRRLESSLGSGVVVSPQGYVLTNHHVVAGADQIAVMLADGRTAEASVVGSDPETDLAVLRVALGDAPAITLGDSEHLRVGDVVLAIGNPLGIGQTVTMGIVSAVGRSDFGINTYARLVQTDAAINPGNSGGALVDARGRLVGVNQAILSQSGGSEGIGFAIPVSLARVVMTDLIEKGRVSRGWLGVEVLDLTPELAGSLGLREDRGVAVAGVLRGGPAQRAGIAPGDVITGVAGIEVLDRRHLLEAVAAARPGSRLPVDLRRGGDPVRLEVVVEERPVSSTRD